MTSRWQSLGRYFPLPLVSVAVLLVILIFITPNFTSPAGTLATQAQLIVDRVAGTNQTNFYVRGIGTARYAEASLALATNAVWPAVLPPSPPLDFSNVTSANNTLGFGISTDANPVAVNVTAVYRDTTGACVAYTGTFVFEFVIATQTLDYVDIAPSSSGAVQSASLSSLPLPLLLNSAPLGVC